MKTLTGIGIAAATAALLYYPSLRLYRYLTSRKSAKSQPEEHHEKAFAPAYTGKRHAHRRIARKES